MIYPADFEKKIGFDRIRELVSGYCLGRGGVQRTLEATFNTSFDVILPLIDQTAEFQRILSFEDDFPVDHYFDLTKALSKIRIEGAYPELSELFDLYRSLTTQKAIFNFIRSRNRDKIQYPQLDKLIMGISVFPFLFETIDRILTKDGAIRDNASPELSEIRREIKKLMATVSRRLHAILKDSQAQGIVEKEATISIRNGRGVIPVGAYDKRRIDGLIHDQSATGKTVFIEPAEIVSMNNRLVELEHSEKREIVKILTHIADTIRPYLSELMVNYEIMGEIDYIRSRALLGQKLGSIRPGITDGPDLGWKAARHPLLYLAFQKLEGRRVEPLDIVLDSKNRLLVISGPNAGGKSVCLKSVGLIQYMLQCGYTVPVAQESVFGIFKSIFIDIGDEQSIDNDLSTYSSHLLNMKYFLKSAGSSTLLLIDEFGTGTEPMLGGAIAESILADFNKKGVYGVITTHYTNLKHFASSTDGIINGAMMFDNHLMQPLFRLDIGKPGSSFAFEIARKIGLPEEILKKATESIGEDHINFDRHLKDILRDKRYWENKRQEIRSGNKKLDELIEQYEVEMVNLKEERRDILKSAREEAERVLNEANRQIENTIREIKESQAEKNRTKEVREDLEKLKLSVKEGMNEETRIEHKIKKLKEREKNVKERKAGKSKVLDKGKSELSKIKTPLVKGEYVVIEGTSIPGEVVAIRGTRITIAFENVSSTVELSRLRRLTPDEQSRSKSRRKPQAPLDWDVTHRKSRFNSERDVRGMRAEAALTAVQEMLDEAIVIQYPTIRILHGKGDGILRQVIRQYLSTVPLVSSYRDENVESGGSGITIVDLKV